MAQQWAAGDLEEIDLRGIVHAQHQHQQLLAPAALAWWLLSVRPDVPIRLPSDVNALLSLARSGLLFVLTRQDVASRTRALRDGNPLDLADLRGGQLELGNVDWARYAGMSPVDRVRAVRDLEDPRRRPPPPVRSGRHFTWVDNLSDDALGGQSAASGDPSWAQALRSFNGDGDQVLFELVSNVHAWAFPAEQDRSERRAVATCSISAGQVRRLHIVVMDNGQGIPTSVTRAQERQECGGSDWRTEVLPESPADLHHDPAAALLHLLTHRAFLARQVRSTQDGHGLFTATIKAGQHQGLFRLLTVDGEPGTDALKFSSRATDGEPTTDRVPLPGAIGTLAYATLSMPSRQHENSSATSRRVSAGAEVLTPSLVR